MIAKLSRYSVALVVAVCLVLIERPSATAQDDSQPADSPQAPPPEPPPLAPPAPGLDESETTVGDDLGYQPLMQGPVHEAFAAPIDADPTDGVRVFAKAPPEPVNEQPPEGQPADEEMKWIPGYWTWSDEQKDYVWVSGLWRKLPPGRTWNPGSWSETSSGHSRWTPGYWTAAPGSTDTADYLPMPPKSIDNGPSVPPPGVDYFWVPGCWEYADSDYHWRSGFWSAQQSGWIWQPACYRSTPGGYVLIDGYWDYAPSERGELYAPVTFSGPVYLQPSYVYRPRYPLAGAASLLLNLFVRSGYPHYYYGNFYGPSYSSYGYRPWYDVGYGYGYGSPLFGYYDWKYRKSGINFGSSMQHYKKDLHANPSGFAHTDRSVVGSASRGSSAAQTAKPFGRSLDDVVKSHRVSSTINRNPYVSRGNSAIRSSSSRDLSRSTRNLSPAGSSFRGSSSSGFRSSGAGNSSSMRLPSSNTRSPSLSTRLPSSNIQIPSSNIRVPSNVGRSSSFPSMRSSVIQPSGNRGGISSSPSVRSSIGGSSQSSRSFSGRSPGSSPSFQRSPSQSFNRGGSSSGFSGRGNSGGGFSRGNSGGGSGRSNSGGGFSRGSSGGGSKSMGSRGRGKGK